MMKSLFLFFQFILILFINPVHCDKELKNTFQSIEGLKKGKELIAEATKEGPISIKIEDEFPFDAYWDPNLRTIGIATNENQAYSIVFELQNAASQKKFDELDQKVIRGQISKNDYVKQVEKIEYQNTFKTGKIIDEGIEKGIFPLSSKTSYHPNFDDHFRDQIRKGHSAYIASSYENLKRQN